MNETNICEKRDACSCKFAQLKDEIARLRLTAEERDAIVEAIADDEAASAYDRAAVLRSLLARLTGGVLRGLLERIGGER